MAARIVLSSLKLLQASNLFKKKKDVPIQRRSVPYFFGYKKEFYFFQNNPKNLDPSYKMDLDFWDCLGRVKLVS